MPPLPVISGDEFVRAMSRIGWTWDPTAGSHMILIGPNRQRLSVPRHRERDRGTLRALIRQAGVSVEDFLAMIE